MAVRSVWWMTPHLPDGAGTKSDAVPDHGFRHLLRGRVRAALGAESVPAGVEVVHARRELRLLRVVGLASRVPPRARERHRASRRDLGGTPGGRAQAPAPDGPRGGGDPPPARMVQVLRLLRR